MSRRLNASRIKDVPEAVPVQIRVTNSICACNNCKEIHEEAKQITYFESDIGSQSTMFSLVSPTVIVFHCESDSTQFHLLMWQQEGEQEYSKSLFPQKFCSSQMSNCKLDGLSVASFSNL